MTSPSLVAGEVIRSFDAFFGSDLVAEEEVEGLSLGLGVDWDLGV